MSTAVLIGWDPQPSPSPRIMAQIRGALLVSSDRRHLLLTPCLGKKEPIVRCSCGYRCAHKPHSGSNALRQAYLGPPGREKVKCALVPSYSCPRQSGQVQPTLSLSGDIPAHLALFFATRIYIATYRSELALFHTDSGSVKKKVWG